MHKTYENIDASTLRLLYGRYKDFIVPFFVMVAVFLLVVRVIVPQIQDLFKANEEQKAAMETLTVMQNNLNLLKSIDDSTLDSQLAIVSTALPINKDFGLILNTLSDVSNKASVTLGDFRLNVGSLSKEEDNGKFTTFKVELIVKGSVNAVDDFVGWLSKTFPLSEVTAVSLQGSSSTVAIGFYYKPFTRLQHDDSLPISRVSNKGLSLIDKISTTFFSTAQVPSENPMPILESTPSANPFF